MEKIGVQSAKCSQSQTSNLTTSNRHDLRAITLQLTEGISEALQLRKKTLIRVVEDWKYERDVDETVAILLTDMSIKRLQLHTPDQTESLIRLFPKAL